jgi:hypothetical protein
VRLPGSDTRCGPLLELGHVQRQLHLGAPILEGVSTIAVAQIIGTTSRAQDFDACWHPLRPSLEDAISMVVRAGQRALDAAIEVIRVDRAYFVVDGHKRVAIAKRTEREWIDAKVSHLSTPYAITEDVATHAIERTAREGEFRRHSGLDEGVPGARFALNNIDDYGELFESVQLHALELSRREGRLVPAPEAAADWFNNVYLPGVASLRERVGDLLAMCTDADVFLAFHRQYRAHWGSDCDAIECAAEQILAARQRDLARERSPLSMVLGIGQRREEPQPELLPLADGDPSS